MFDPSQWPVLSVDTHLPSIDAQQLQPERLRQRFLAAPHWRAEAHEAPLDGGRAPQSAAVLVPLVARPAPTLLLTQRTAHLQAHPGQIAFPGGKVDAGDANAQATALREAQEEIGLDPAQVEVLGILPPYTTATAYVITPVVALVDRGYHARPNPAEVAEVFEVPLAFLMNPSHHQRRGALWEGRMRHWYAMPYPDPVRERFIWGATAGMLRNLYHFLAADMSAPV